MTNSKQSDPRAAKLEAATANKVWDFIVVGGGASGLGTAVEAANRGYSVLLLEAVDYAKGTSSRSTKLVHGGVRYLAQGNIGLVREALHERGLLRKNAPHLVHDLEFVVPAYSWWSGPFYGIGLKMYDVLAGKLNYGDSRYLDKEAALERVPTLQEDGLMGGILYHDGQFDDARLAITLMQTLEDLGGVALNHAPVRGLLMDGGKVSGVRFEDAETGQTHEARARLVINATGVWVDDIRQMENPEAKEMLSPSQGVHVVVDKKFLPAGKAIMIPKTDDGRVLFAVPWHGHTIIGTTDTPVESACFEPEAMDKEIDFILKTADQYMNPAPTRADVLSVYVGLRPLVKPSGDKETKSISREHVIVVSDGNLVTLTGGKWTTYRNMGEETVDRAEQVARMPQRLSTTRGLHLHGWSEETLPDHMQPYGSDAAKVQALEGADKVLSPRLPYTEAQVRWAVREESARSVEDVLARRLRAQLLDARASLDMAPRVAAILAEELGKGEDWQHEQVKAYKQVTEGYVLGEAVQQVGAEAKA